MRTLFSENILSPPPKPAPPNKPNPFELSFQSNTTSIPPSSTTSSYSSPRQNDWLTEYYQSQQRAADSSNQTSNDASARYGHARRKGNPKLLFMGMRRQVSKYWRDHTSVADLKASGVESPPFKRSSSKSSPQQRRSISSLQHEQSRRHWSKNYHIDVQSNPLTNTPQILHEVRIRRTPLQPPHPLP